MKKVRIISNIVIFALLGILFTAAIAGGAVAAVGGHTAVYRGSTDRPYVSIMFNVRSGGHFIRPILAVADQHDVSITFFVTGTFVKSNPELIQEINARGHEIANHGFSSRDAGRLSFKENYDEIYLTSRVIESTIGQKTQLFAPPFGSQSYNMFRAANELSHEVIMWTRDTRDLRDPNPDLVFSRATRSLRNGDLILMHPTAHTVEALPRILQHIKSNGFLQVPVSRNIAVKGV